LLRCTPSVSTDILSEAPGLLAGIVGRPLDFDLATDSLEAAINDIEADVPNDAKGQAIVPAWISEYRIYIEDRRDFIEALRTAERRPYFAETEIQGVPVSERIGKFARENDMRTCQPPLDLSV
jgi:hypothetical protein